MIDSGKSAEIQANGREIAQAKSGIFAAVLIIGDEILSGRTQDKNLGWLAEYLAPLGIEIREARVVADIQSAIIAAVNELRARYTYVFTTGGIGPTPDDITAEAIAAAFGIAYGFHPEAKKILEAHYGAEANEARMRMAKMPVTARLIDNPVSRAPGFYVENVFVLAGVPKIMQAMMMSLDGILARGQVRQSISFLIDLPESKAAPFMTATAEKFPDVSIGSYPKMLDGGGYENTLVLRGYDAAELEGAKAFLQDQLRVIGGEIYLAR